MRVIVAETNSRDYSKDGWGPANNLGHAIVTFETFGRLLGEPRISAALLWTTRWVDQGKALEDIFYALDDGNVPTASGMAVGLWGRHLHARLLAVEGAAGPLRAHASASVDGTAWTVWLVNRGRDAADGVRVRLGGLGGTATAYRLRGSSPDDIHPVQDAPTLLAIADGAVGPLTLPPLSITVITGR